MEYLKDVQDRIHSVLEECFCDHRVDFLTFNFVFVRILRPCYFVR